MAEELKIEVDVRAKDDNAKKTLDGLIKEYDKKTLNLDVKLGKINVGELQTSINKLTGDLTSLSNIKFDNLNKLATNLKKVNNLLSQQQEISTKKVDKGNLGALESEYADVQRLVDDKEKALKKIQGMEALGKDIAEAMDEYNKETSKAYDKFKNDQNELKSIMRGIAGDSYEDEAFREVLNARMRAIGYMKQMEELPVTKIDNSSLRNEQYDGSLFVSENEKFVTTIKATIEEEERLLNEVRRLASNRDGANSTINKYINDLTKPQRELIEQLSKKFKEGMDGLSTFSDVADMHKRVLKESLENCLPEFDKMGLDFEAEGSISEGFKRYFNALDEMKDEFRKRFSSTADFDVDPFESVNQSFENLDKTAKAVDLSNLRKELTSAFDIDDKVIDNISKIENALRQLNSMSELTQRSLFGGNSVEGMGLDLKIKEYLELDKKINDALTKMSKAEFSKSTEVVNSLNKEIELLRQKQALVTKDIRQGNLNDDLRSQIRLQEELNKAISRTEQAEFRSKSMDGLHAQALKLNQEFDEVHKKQQEIANFTMPEVFDTKGIKSYVNYLDSAADGIKRILTQSSAIPGRDLTTTMYGDGTRVRKEINNIEKSVNQLSSAYKQVDNELTRLIKSQDKLKASGDTQTVALLEKQVASWKQMRTEIENAAKSANVYEQVMDKVKNTTLKNNNALDTNRSQIEVRLDVDHSNAVRKVEEFRTKTLSNLQELERKYQGTQMFDQVVREVEKFKNELKELDRYLEDVERVDMTGLSNEFRRINQAVTQTRRDMGDLNRTMKNNFFDDLYDSMRTFTLGNLIGDALQNGVYAIKETIVGLDSAMRDMMKVAPAGFEGTSEQLKMVKNDAIEAAKAVGRSSEDVIQGMSKALQTGAKTMSDALEIAKSSATFAAVGDLSQDQADKYIASIMSAYGGMTNALRPVREQITGMGQDYNQLTNFMDLANYAGNNFAISTGDVGEALMRSGSVLSEFGVSMQDAVSMIVGANESVQDAEKVGTAIKTMATNLGGMKAAAKDGSMEMNRTAKALKTIAGIEIYSDKQTGEIKDMMTILKELNEVWDDLGEDEQLSIAESIAGKNHINTLMAMMGNWDSVLQLQEDYNNGFTVGSAQREQERYLNSIEGKWNTLKENLKGLVTTVITSDFAKGALDGAIAFTDGLSSAFAFLDKFNATLPVTIGLITALGQSFKVLSGNGAVSIFGSGMVNGIRAIKRDLQGVERNFAATGNSILRLSGNQTKLATTTTKTSRSFKTYTNSVNSAGQSVLRINRSNSTLVAQQTRVSGGLANVAKGFKNSAVASKLAMVGTTLLNGALVGLAVAGIGAAIKAFDNYINRHEIAAEKARESIDVINGEKQQYQSQKKQLGEIADEYDKLAQKANKSTEEVERFNELKGQIAEVMPELVLGYDENNNPILAMQGDVTDLISEIDRAIESKQRLLESKEGDLANNATETIKKTTKALKESATWMKANLETGGDLTLNKNLNGKNIFGDTKDIKKRTQNLVKALEEQELAYTKSYNDHLNNLEEYNRQEQEIQKKNLNQLFKKDNYKNLTDDLKGNVNSFASIFDWGEYDLSGQKQMVNGINELNKAISDGKFDIEDFNKRWQGINDTFQNTGDIDNYNKSIEQLAKELEAATGVDAGKWIDGLNQQFQGLDYADAKLNKFLQSYGSSLDKLKNQDSLALALQKQYEELKNFSVFMQSELLANGKIEVEPLIEVKNSESFKYLPKQIQEMVNGVLADGKVTEAEQDLLLTLTTIIENEGAISDDVAEELNKIFAGNASEQALEVGLKIGDFEMPPELVKLLNNEYKNKGVNVDFKVNAQGVEEANQKVQELEKAFAAFRENKSMELMIELVGEEKAQLYADIITKLPVNETLTNKLILENSDALANLKSYEEVVQWLKKNPQIATKYNLEVNGKGELVQAKEDVENLDGKEAKTKVKVEADTKDAEDGLDKVQEKKEEVSEPTKLTVNNGELQGSVEEFSKLIEYSTKLKNGEYQISFKSDTADAITQIDNLKLAVNNLSNQFMQIPSTTISIDTERAAKNISGLLVRIDEIKTALGSVKSKDIQISTEQPAKNLSGLIRRVDEYKIAIGSIQPKNCEVITERAAKNLTGLMNKISSYNGIKIPTKTVSVNAKSAISQLDTLIGQLRSLPQNKTVNVRVAQTGSVPKIAPRTLSLTPDISSNKIGLLSPKNGDNFNGLDVSSMAQQLHLSTSDLQLMNDAVSSFDVKEIAKANAFAGVPVGGTPNATYVGGTVEFNSPLIVIEGNVDEKIMPDLKKAMQDLKKEITKDMKINDVRKKRLEGR